VQIRGYFEVRQINVIFLSNNSGSKIYGVDDIFSLNSMDIAAAFAGNSVVVVEVSYGVDTSVAISFWLMLSSTLLPHHFQYAFFCITIRAGSCC
jgi:hypothetical protein